MKKIVVLGAGLVGSAIAIDLSKNHDVTSVDVQPEALQKFKNHPEIKTVQANVENSAMLKKLLAGFV